VNPADSNFGTQTWWISRVVVRGVLDPEDAVAEVGDERVCADRGAGHGPPCGRAPDEDVAMRRRDVGEVDFVGRSGAPQGPEVESGRIRCESDGPDLLRAGRHGLCQPAGEVGET